jgi:exonuclease III
MNFLIWNVRGLNHPSKQKEVKNMIKCHKISFICLIETRVKIQKADVIRSYIVPDWDYVYNYDQHFLGRIWVCWKKDEFEVIVLDKSYQSINCVVKSIKNNLNWFHSFIYGDNKGVDRKLLCMNLASMKTKVANNPWMICGDFNVVRSLAEKWGSKNLNSYEIEFGQCLNDLKVMDLNFSGCFYTWTNKSEIPRFVARKLDRVLANEYWGELFWKDHCGIQNRKCF